jgi:ABC-type spermidine/putrescine transport system permease subunit II
MFDKIEPETRKYLKKVLNTLFIGLFWMFANVIFGIFLEYGFVQGAFTLKNIIYYSVALTTLVWLISYFIKLWGSK